MWMKRPDERNGRMIRGLFGEICVPRIGKTLSIETTHRFDGTNGRSPHRLDPTEKTIHIV
jgi:hypothetical protein